MSYELLGLNFEFSEKGRGLKVESIFKILKCLVFW